ncbi:MAG: ATP-binding protein [Desulfurivibrionaceae bacterium]|nr:ATP-binding protein [Desulfobacterales bacterium]MDT8335469.1 ATP-binding protein [Desulfurivibrionaceae bacterium]
MKRFFPRSREDWFFCGTDSASLSIEDRSRCLKRSLLITMMLITMIPLCLTVGISFIQYRKLLQEETFINASWSAENARQTIEAYLERLQAAILVVSDAYTIQELVKPKTFGQIFLNLKAEHKGLVDLSLIGPDGTQLSYAGPYDLAGKNYSDSPWYNQALTRKVFVSEVFLGYRNIPHFVIAASKRNPDARGCWTLRASIDTETLDRFLSAVNNEAVDDIFLINEQGVLQSSSRYYGRVNSKVVLKIKPKKSGITMLTDQKGGQSAIRAIGYVRGTPWILVQDHQGYFHKKTWLSFRSQLALIFLICFVLSGAVAYRVATFLAASIRKSEESRELILQETEHTGKLASIGRLAAGVAHEINNPLAIINEKTGLMKDLLQQANDFPYREKFLAQLDSLENAVSRSRVITHRLLSFARRMEVKLERIALPEVIEEVLGFLDKGAAYRNITIEKFFHPNLPAIQSDRGQLQQIFLNIINNAIDAVGEGGEISISVQETARGTLQVDISDNGPGIAPEIAKNIFEPFFTTKKGKDQQGTGLGLSISYGIVKKLGGDITVNSEPGVGTTFSILFPAVTDNTEETGNDKN